MREHPIIFSGPMVRAILAGQKTQTRRVIKPQPIPQVFVDPKTGPVAHGITKHAFVRPQTVPGCIALSVDAFNNGYGKLVCCPYGQPGDRLWVRETWHPFFKRTDESNGCVYRADDDGVHLNPGWSPSRGWKSSMFMPRWASRLTLEITDIRVQRVQELSYNDVIAEGLSDWLTDEQQTDVRHMAEAKQAYARLWESINGKKFPWGSNPWVWAIDFRRL